MTSKERDDDLAAIRRNERVRGRRRLVSTVLIIGALTVTNTVALVIVVFSFDRRVVGSTFKREAICSASRQGAPCRALFDRMWKSMDDVQRFRVACDALVALRDRETSQIYRRAGCP